MSVATADLVDYDDDCRLRTREGYGGAMSNCRRRPRCPAVAPLVGAEPNTLVCPVCLWGACPARCPCQSSRVESAIRIGFALNCDIAPWGGRPEELLLSRPAEELPDLAVRRADRGQRLPRCHSTTARRGGTRSNAPTWEEDTGKLTHLGSDTGASRARRRRWLRLQPGRGATIEIVTKPIEGTARA